MSKNVMKKRDVDGGDLSPTSKNVATTGQSESNVFFSGVGGSGRRPVNPPTPEGSGARGSIRTPF